MSKRIVVHIGPPKTGTSALQYWFLANRSELGSFGVYYPKHDMGCNHISSGHVDLLFDRCRSPGLTFHAARYERLLDDFARSGCHTLLLSSEFFYHQADELHQILQGAEFVLYLRNPLEIPETIYNQEVKRHFQKKKFCYSQTLAFDQIEILARHVASFGSEHLRIQTGGERFYVGGNIVSDMLHDLGVPIPPPA